MSNKKLEFDHDALEKLQYQTPYFLFSKKKLLDNYKEYKKCFPGSLIQYAMKANAEPDVLRLLFEAGSGFEVASAYELHMLQEIGIPPERIVYGTSVKPMAHIKEFFEYGVDKYAFDSLPELEKIASVAPGAKVYVRMIANDSGSVFKFSEKFGTNKDNIVPLLQRAKELGLHPYGISFHVGSQASNPMAWAKAVESLVPVLKHLHDVGIDIDVINLGGGYPCNYASAEEDIALQQIADNTLAAYDKLPYKPQLMLEPGRGMIATTAIVVASVIGRVERAGSTWLFLDTGVYDSLYEALAFQGSTRYHVTSMRQSYSAGEAMFAIAGPTGDSHDIITREALLPQDIAVGDKLVFHDVGAYSLVVSSKFNGFPKPSVYWN
ncbi:MAG: type III PLP-dependent enzyme [Candidatus Andersenbacteria bacterium]